LDIEPIWNSYRYLIPAIECLQLDETDDLSIKGYLANNMGKSIPDFEASPPLSRLVVLRFSELQAIMSQPMLVYAGICVSSKQNFASHQDSYWRMVGK